jgi:hypothetical protein
LQEAALNGDYNERLVAHGNNAAWLKQEVARLRGMAGKDNKPTGDYEGQSGLWRSHIENYEARARAIEAEAAAQAKQAAAASAVKAVMPDEIISQWFQGELPAMSLNSLADNLLTSELVKAGTTLEDIHARIEKVAGKEAPHIAALFGRSEQYLAAKFPESAKKDYTPTEEYLQAARWAFATEMEIIGNAPFAALNRDSGTLLNKLNAALSSRDLGKIDPGKMLQTIQLLGSGTLDEEISLDPHGGQGIPGYVYPDAKTEEKYGQFGRNVANMLKDAGVIPNASGLEMRHFPEKGPDGRTYGAAGDVYFINGATGEKYHAIARDKNVVLQRQSKGENLFGGWADIPMPETRKKLSWLDIMGRPGSSR